MVGCALVRDAATAASMAWLTLGERQLSEGDHSDVRRHCSVGSRVDRVESVRAVPKNQKSFSILLWSVPPLVTASGH